MKRNLLSIRQRIMDRYGYTKQWATDVMMHVGCLLASEGFDSDCRGGIGLHKTQVGQLIVGGETI